MRTSAARSGEPETREALLGRLLLLLVQATAAELAKLLAEFSRRVGARGLQEVGAVDDAQAALGAESNELSEGPTDTAQPAPSPSPAPERAEPFRYRLRREPACWVLVFRGERAYLKPQLGLAYVAYLLAHSGEPVPSARLFSEFSPRHRRNLPGPELLNPETGLPEPITDGVAVAGAPPDADEAEARRRYWALLSAYKATMDDDSLPPAEREEARRQHDELVAFLKEHYRPAPDPGRAVTKAVHRAIQRLCDHLREPPPSEKRPSPIAQEFAGYIEAHILVPSRRFTRAKAGANVRVGRGELAGRLVFECPPGDQWSVLL